MLPATLPTPECFRFLSPGGWCEWMKIEELYVWQKYLSRSVDCGLVGFDVLNNTYQIKVPGRPYAFVTDNIANQLQQIYNNINRSDGSD